VAVYTTGAGAGDGVGVAGGGQAGAVHSGEQVKLVLIGHRRRVGTRRTRRARRGDGRGGVSWMVSAVSKLVSFS